MNYALEKELTPVERNRIRNREHYRTNRAEMLARKKEWQASNPDKVRESRRKTNFKIKTDTIARYGGRCACCKESDIAFLSIDHINNNGAEERSLMKKSGGGHFYYWLKKQGYPEGYQVLCYNCNMGKAIYKVCPHQSHTN